MKHNTQAKTKKMIQCVSRVNQNAITKQLVDGIEYIVVSSYTLPDDIVMNDILYPADEIEKSYKSLERTLAPVEHPVNSLGEFISATDPFAINNFYAGAYNVNVSRENGRVHVEKHICVPEALKTDRGKRLLDRINELENSDNPRPVHTSIGVFLEVERCKKPKKNAAGDEYSMIARNMIADHDAILLDSVGAATPEQGVGMAVNSDGSKVSVDRVMITNAVMTSTGLPLADSGMTWDKSAALKRVKSHIGAEDTPNAIYARYHLWYDSANSENFGAYKLPFVDIIDGSPMAVPAALRNAAARLDQTDGPTDAEKTKIKGIIDGYLSKLKTNAEGMSYTEMLDQISMEIKNTVAADWMWIVDLYQDMVIFETNAGYFQVPYTVSGDKITLAGIPIRVDKVVEYQPRINQKQGEDKMRQLILNALAQAGIQTEGMSDDDLFKAYNELLAGNKKEPETNTDDLATAISNALKPITDQLTDLTTKVNAGADQEKNNLIQTIINSKKYPGIDEAGAKLLTIDSLKMMAAHCSEAHGIPLTTSGDNTNDFGAPTEMPE